MTLLKINQPSTRSINGWMEDILKDFSLPVDKTFQSSTLNPLVNITETKDEYRLEIAAPGRSKEDFKINIENNLLTISYEKQTGKNEGEKFIKREFNIQPFKRSFTLDNKIQSDNIKVRYENGLLTFQLPKKEEEKASSKVITVE